MTIVLNDSDVEQALTMGELIECLEAAFAEMGRGGAVNAPRRECYMRSPVADGYYVFKTMEGGSEALGILAQRINSDLLTYPVVNGVQRKVKVPAAPGNRYVGLVFLYSARTLELLAILHDGHLQRMRVAGTIGIGIKHLARTNARVVALLGSGWQAETAAIAACAVRDIELIRVYSPNEAHRDSFARKMKAKLGIEVESVKNSQQAVSGSDIVIATTNSEGTVVRGEQVSAGMHLTCVTPTEFDDEAWRRSDIIVYSSLHVDFSSFASEGVPLSTIPTESSQGEVERRRNRLFGGKMMSLSDLLLGRKTGRSSDSQITLMSKGMGLGIEFAATAKKAYEVAKLRGIGKEIPTEWFTQTSHP